MTSRFRSDDPSRSIIRKNPENRGDKFKNFIISLLRLCKLSEKYIAFMTNDVNMKIFGYAFTHESADETKDKSENYEIYEKLGDVILNGLIVKYTLKKFPQLRNSKGVSITSLILAKFGSKETFSKIADEHGFSEFIFSSEYEYIHKRKSLLEDTFEAFAGAVSIILDESVYPCVEYSPLFNLITYIYDKIDIRTEKKYLIDSITKLKEIGDAYSKQKGYSNPEYDISGGSDGNPFFIKVTLKFNDIIYQGEGIGQIKKTAQNKAAFNLLNKLFTRHPGLDA